MADTAAPIPWSIELRTLACRYAQRPAVEDDLGCLTYEDLDARARALAQALAQRLTDGPLDVVADSAQSASNTPHRVGVLLSNGRAAVIADYAISVAGACVVHLNPAYSAADLDWCKGLAPFDLLITEEALLSVAADLPMETWILNADGALNEAGTASHAGKALGPRTSATSFPSADPHREARIIFTSGSSGRPKAAVYTHHKRWMAATVLRSVLPYRPKASNGIILMTPYVHGASSLARVYLECGSRVALMHGIDPTRLRIHLENRSFDALFAPPSVLAKLAQIFEGKQFDHIRCVYTGTQPLPVGVYRKAVAIFGPCLRVTYGKTENLNPITVLEPEETHHVYQLTNAPTGTCVGYPGPGVELRLSAAGEVELRSQHQYCGYLTESGYAPHAPDDWHATGDLGEFDIEGRLWLKGRRGETINTGGYMVSPDDIEAALSTADGVKELCVVGIPSDYWTEVIVCVYVPAAEPFDPVYGFGDALQALTKYKRPRLYASAETISRTAAGKVDRRAMRAWLLESHTLVDGPYPSLARRSLDHA